MGRPASGSILSRVLADGTLQFRLRFPAYGERHDIYLHESRNCDCGCGGNWNERTAQVELENLVTLARAGIWQPAEEDIAAEGPPAIPFFDTYSLDWLAGKVAGIIGELPIGENTESNYKWRLNGHLIPFFGSFRLDEIDRDLCLAFKAEKLKEAQELRRAAAAGATVLDRQGRPKRPLGADSLKKTISTLRAILDEAIEDGHIAANPARSRRLRIRVPKPKRTFLEADELAALEEAASRMEPLIPPRPASTGVSRESTCGQIAGLVGEGIPPHLIAERLGLARSTVSHHLSRLGIGFSPYLGRRAIVTCLGRTGLRVSELCDTKIGHIRLHDPDGARLHIPDAKTEAGIRTVEISPDLAEILVMHLDRIRRAGHPTGPDAWAFPNSRGGRLTRERAAIILTQVAENTSIEIQKRCQPPLPRVSPHTLRRTYISLALLANNFDVKWVMGQVGHADSKMTMDVYAHLQQRAKRNHGVALDRLIQEAREEITPAPVEEMAA